MRNKKQKLWALALTLPLALSAVLGFSLLKPEAAKAETLTPLLRYDFSAENLDGNTVKNLGSKQNSNATLVAGQKGTVKVENGKLKFNQTDASIYKTTRDLGYFELPSDMFSGLQEDAFTFRMDVNSATVNAITNGLLHFTKADPLAKDDSGNYIYGNGHWTASKKGVESDGNIIGSWWDSGKLCFYPNSATGTNYGNHNIVNGRLYEAFTLSLVWNGSQLKIYLNDLDYANATISSADVRSLVVNRIGGYLMGTWNSDTEYAEGNDGWGRNAITAMFDNVEFYGVAMSASEIANLNASTIVDDKALLSYDFSSDSISADGKTIQNKGTKANSDAAIIDTKNGVNAYYGKLKLTQSEKTATDNGYFKMPEDMFGGLNEFTFRMDIDYAWINDNQSAILNFLPVDPATGSLTSGSYIEASWAWGTSKYYMISSPWDNDYARENITDYVENVNGGYYVTKPFTLSIVWNGDALLFYGDETLWLKTSITSDAVANLTLNRIGGYLYNWGRNSVYGTFDNVELYDRAFGVKDIKAKNAERSNDAELVLSYDFEDENVDGNVVKNLGVKKNADATLVGSRGGKIQDGKLIFARTNDYKYGNPDDENSYLRLPDDMFIGLEEFTLSVDIDYADVYSYTLDEVAYATRSLWSFMPTLPLTTTETGNVRFAIDWSYLDSAKKFLIGVDDPKAWNSAYATCMEAAAAAGKGVSDGKNVRYDDFTDQQFTLSLVYKCNSYKVYWDDVEVFESGANLAITPADFANFVVNRFGGYYLYRNAACGEYDNIKMWSKAFSVQTLKENATRNATEVIITGANDSVIGYSDNGTYVLPETAEIGENQRLIGYIYKNALYAPGESIAVSGRTVRAKAVVVDFEMKTGASLRLTTLKDSGLRFRTYYAFDYTKLVQRLSDDTDLARVKSLISDNVSFGTLVTFADAIAALGDVSFENANFNVEGETRYIDIKTNIGTVYDDEESGKKAYNSAIINLNSYSLEYAARSYLTVTYGDKKANYYTTYTRENNARSAQNVAKAIKEKDAELYEQFQTIIDAYISGVKGE